jgi:hypothetical protein
MQIFAHRFEHKPVKMEVILSTNLEKNEMNHLVFSRLLAGMTGGVKSTKNRRKRAGLRVENGCGEDVSGCKQDDNNQK